MPDAIAMPDVLGSPLGELHFRDGLPLPDAVEKSYDLLDLTRGIDVYLNTIPGASLVAMRRGFRSVGLQRSTQLGYTAPRAGSESTYLTPNTETVYGSTFLDLKADGPTVVESPPNSLCVLDDFWFRYVTDLGLAGPDRGAGGKYLFLPPDFDGRAPDGYFTFRCPTYTNWLVVRALSGLEGIRQTRIYPLALADAPPQMEFINLVGKPHNTVHANDVSYYAEIDELVQEEPVEALDPERAGQLAAIGIVKGRPFSPDDRLKGILEQAAPLAAGIARSLAFKPRDPSQFLWEGSSWKVPFAGGSYEFVHNGARLLDARALYHYIATVVTPAMAAASVGTGSQYVYTAQDADGEWLDGAKTYRLRLPADVPAKNFWSIDVYDAQTRSLLQTDDPHPSVMSLGDTLQANADGCTDVWFGPAVPDGLASNWIQTVPGKAWWPMLRIYGPLEAWFDQTWRPGEIERVS